MNKIPDFGAWGIIGYYDLSLEILSCILLKIVILMGGIVTSMRKIIRGKNCYIITFFPFVHRHLNSMARLKRLVSSQTKEPGNHEVLDL